MDERTIQRCVFPAERALQSLYYRLDRPLEARMEEPAPPDRFAIRIPAGWKLITDTYFNTFFECYWRRYTRLGRLRLRLELSGSGTVLLLRRSQTAGLSVLQTVAFGPGPEEVVLEVPEPRLHFRELGALYFDLFARGGPVELRKAEWLAVDVEWARVGLVAGYCTFNREKFLLDNVRALLGDPGLRRVLRRIVVVDQGTSQVRDHPDFGEFVEAEGDTLQVVEQGNYGGAGGFTRSILEARSVAGATHMLLMDDDAVIETESVFRAAAFHALARDEMAVGGQMLDMLRPTEVYESGALVDAHALGVATPVHRLNVEATLSMWPFLEVQHTHYNAWWFFAFPLHLVDRVGLPLPLFIRGDDVEFGYRLHAAGIPTATVPGFGIWHEPFYLKKGGWQPYYDLRNLLVLTSSHFALSPKRVVRVVLSRLVEHLLSLDYFQAALVCEAVDDFLRGPRLLEDDPRAIHLKLLAMKRELAQGTVARDRCLPKVKPAGPPVSWPRRKWHLLRCLLRQVLRPSPPEGAGPGVVVPEEYGCWWFLATTDVVAVEDWHGEEHRVARRSRESFLRTLGRGLTSALRLYRGYPSVAADWRAAFGRLTSVGFWDQYLGIEREAALHADGEDRARRAA